MDKPQTAEAAQRSELEHLILDLTHDLKGPLANIKGFVELLEEGTLPPEQARHFLERIRYNTTVMSRLITDLGELSRIGIESECVELVDAGEVVRDALLALERTVAERGALLSVSALPPVRYPRARLLQVFVQLVGNALRHTTRQDALRIAIECRTGGGEHCFRVSDNGPGIDAAESNRIFDPFFAPSKKATGASGLGLAIVRRIVEKHGGRVWAESAPGGGATFCFTVPA